MPDTLTPDPPLTVAEFARMVGCSLVHAYEILHAGKLRSYKIGAHYRIPRSEAEKYMRAKPQPAVPTTRGGKNGQARKPTKRAA